MRGGSASLEHDDGLIGRDAERAVLEERLHDAVDGRGGLVLVVGEAGIGKSRLAESLMERAVADGVTVAVGRCADGPGTPGFWPWVQILRELARRGVRTGGACGPGEGALRRLVPELGEGPATEEPAASDPAEVRFWLFDAVRLVLRRAVETAPMALFLKDIEDADDSSLRLLATVASEAAGLPLLLVATHRDEAFGPSHPLARIEPDLRRAPRCSRLLLRGLSPEATGRLAAANGAARLPDGVARLLHEQTGGNPLFVEEIVARLRHDGLIDAATGSWLGQAAVDRLPVPDTVRRVLGERLAWLSPDVHHVAAVAALIGRAAPVELLADVLGIGRAELDARLAAAEAARVLVADAVRGQWRFLNALAADTLAASVDPVTARALHRRIAEAIAARWGDAPAWLPLRAHHLGVAAETPAERAHAADVALAAGEASMARAACDEAARCFRAAAAGFDDAAARLGALLRQGAAERGAGAAPAALETFRAAAALARSSGDVPAFARAAMGVAGAALLAGIPADGLALLDEARARVPAGDVALQVTLRAVQAPILTLVDRAIAGRACAHEAVAIAEASGDLRLRRRAAIARCQTLHPWPDEMPAAAEAVLALADPGDDDVRWWGLGARQYARLVLGDVEGAEQDLRTWKIASRRLRADPYRRLGALFARVARLVDAGVHADAHRLTADGRAMTARSGYASTDLGWVLATLDVVIAEGRADDLLAPRWYAGEPRPRPLRRTEEAVIARLLAETGAASDVRLLLDRGVPAPGVDPRDDALWVVSLCLLAEAAARIRDGRHVARLAELLTPVAAWNVVGGSGLASRGVVAERLGLLAALDGDDAAAARWFEQALARNGALGQALAVARTQVAYAALLLRGGRAAELARADELLARAIQTARTLELPALLAEAEALQQTVRPPTAASDDGPLVVGVVAPVAPVAPEARAGYLDIVRGEMRRHRGYEIGEEGDELLLAFLDAAAATECLAVVARRLGMRGLVVRTAVHRGDAIDAAARGLGRARDVRVFRPDGDRWVLTYDGVTVRLRPTKGLVYLARLLAQPRCDVHALELVGGGAVASAGSAGPLLDRQARQEYRRRLAELDAEQDEAERAGDVLRAERAQAERDTIVLELARATGLGGRDRTAISDAERARLAVTQRIRGALRLIGEHHPRLAQHLRDSVRTGMRCRYEPRDAQETSWAV